MKIKITQYAKELGITTATARRWFHDGIIQGEQLPTGIILINVEEGFINPKEALKPKTPRAITYTIIEPGLAPTTVDRQQAPLRRYAKKSGYAVISEELETVSPLSANRPVLESIFDRDDWEVLVMASPDRLSPYNTDFIEKLIEKTGKSILYVSSTPNKEEAVEDMLQVIREALNKD